jgi:hypothetical protein
VSSQYEVIAPARTLLPRVVLSLKKESIFGRRNKFLCCTEMVRVVGLSPLRQTNKHRVMQVIVPEAIQTVTTLFNGPNQRRVLGFVLGNYDDVAVACRRSGCHTDLLKNVFSHATTVLDGLGGIQSKAIKMKFADPVRRIGFEEIADRTAVGSVEVEGLPPVGIFI